MGLFGDGQVFKPLLDDRDGGTRLSPPWGGVIERGGLTVTQPAPAETHFTATPCVYGSAPPGALVSASIDGKDLGTATALATEQWRRCTPEGVTLGRVEVRFSVRDSRLTVDKVLQPRPSFRMPACSSSRLLFCGGEPWALGVGEPGLRGVVAPPRRARHFCATTTGTKEVSAHTISWISFSP